MGRPQHFPIIVIYKPRGEPMSGIHVHPHDLIDEGSAVVLSRVAKIGSIQYIFPQVNTIFERNPYPVGTLPHNPVRNYVMGEGTMHVHLPDITNTKGIQQVPLSQKLDRTIEEGADPLMELIQAAQNRPFRIVPWINVLNGDMLDAAGRNGVIDYKGRPVQYWLCPNGPDVIPMWSNYIIAIADRYGTDTFLIDRIRFPDWAGKQVAPSRLFSCFCSSCTTKMRAAGIDDEQLKKQMTTAGQLLKSHRYAEAGELLKNSLQFQHFLAFRNDSVSSMVENLIASVSRTQPDIQLWLDLWPPSYAWLLGQDYARLTKASSTLKHFPYHKLGGGADVQGLINYFAGTDQQKEEAFQAFLSFFDMNYKLAYKQFCDKGFPIEFVRIENEKVRRLSAPGTFIFSGVQMWNLTNSELEDAIQAANDSEADALLYYCYGWAEEALMDTAARFT